MPHQSSRKAPERTSKTWGSNQGLSNMTAPSTAERYLLAFRIVYYHDFSSVIYPDCLPLLADVM